MTRLDDDAAVVLRTVAAAAWDASGADVVASSHPIRPLSGGKDTKGKFNSSLSTHSRHCPTLSLLRSLDKNWGHRPDSYLTVSYSKLFPVAAGAVIDTAETRIVAAAGCLAPSTTDYDDDNAIDGHRTGVQADVFVVHRASDRLPFRRHRPESRCPFPSWTVSARWSAAPAARTDAADGSRFVVVADSPSRPHSAPAPALVAYPTDPAAA